MSVRNSSTAAREARRGFTLTELLVVMGVLAVLAVLTAVGVRKISRESRVASGVNSVTSILGAARALAIRENDVVVVAFRPIWDVTNRQKPQQTEAVVARWSGERSYFAGGGSNANVADRFYVVNEVPPIRLPAGIKVAGPLYEFGNDDIWVTQPEMTQLNPTCKEAIDYSRMVAVMFAPDGSLVTRNPRSSAGDSKVYIDFNRKDLSPADNDPQDVLAGGCANPGSNFQLYWMQDDVEDESNLTVVPFLAVYDDRAARDNRSLDWSAAANMLLELNGPQGFITTNADRIHFNRYTGVAETQGQDQ
ncbi:MAG: prepilin-type N-terminal cleavage/methylation domain-containing protein [Phycisphaerae bacterium]|nr:prepilin-type N-terminal cleavage/methylation domain-containing protein [Phycisphaerae bacterium]